MPIRINCRHCGKRFSAWDDLVGKPVQCPKCQQKMIVPGGEAQLPTEPPPPTAAPPATPSSRKVAPKQQAPSRPIQPHVPIPPPAPVLPRLPTTSQPAARLDDDFDDSDDLPFACPSCNQPMPAHEDLCDQCGYHRILKKRIDISSGVHKPDQTTGFERVFRGQLTDADSAASTLMFMKVAGAIFALAFLFVCHPWSWLVAGVAIVAFLFYRRSQPKKLAEQHDSAVNRDFLSDTIWSITLNCQRAFGWRLLAWPFPKTRALTLHDSTFTDEDLDELDNLAEFQTLDLQGTQISNEGLTHLAELKHLAYVVVRSTNVTPAGVQRLQQALPQVWIWS